MKLTLTLWIITPVRADVAVAKAHARTIVKDLERCFAPRWPHDPWPKARVVDVVSTLDMPGTWLAEVEIQNCPPER